MAGRKIGEAEYHISIKPTEESIQAFRKEIQSLGALTQNEFAQKHKDLTKNQVNHEYKKLQDTVREVDKLFQQSFNRDLGTVNVTKFNDALKKIDLKQLRRNLNLSNIEGNGLFRDLTAQALSANVQLKQTDKWLSKIAHSVGSTISWGLSSSVFNTLLNSVQRAWTYTKELDSSLNNIRIITGQSADEMERFAKIANKTATSLGKGTKDYTDASLIYYQQGLSEADVKSRTETTLKTANVTGQSAQAVSEQLTAVWNGYKVSAQEAELYIDKVAAVAAATAADLEELSTGMSKVASAANLMGVDIDQLNAQLATIVSVTRQAPESVGTALKTIYARMGDIEAGLDAETSLGLYTAEMDKMGFKVLDVNGNLRDMGQVIEEIGNKWQELSREQQIALSQTMAGTRQYNNLLALFDNWDMYTSALETSQTAMGTLQEQQDIYMESTVAHLQKLSTAWESLFDALVDNEGVNDLADTLTGIVSMLTTVVQGVGGGGNILTGLGGISALAFGKDISQSLSTVISRLTGVREKAKLAKEEMDLLNTVETMGLDDEGVNKILEMKRTLLNYTPVISESQMEMGNDLIKATAEIYKQRDAWIKNKQAAQTFIDTITSSNGQYDLEHLGDADVGMLMGKLSGAEDDIALAKGALNRMKNLNPSFKDNTMTWDANKLKDYRKELALIIDTIGTYQGTTPDKMQFLNEAQAAFTEGGFEDLGKDATQKMEQTVRRIQQIVKEALVNMEGDVNLTKKTVLDATQNAEDGVTESIARVQTIFDAMKKEMELTRKINEMTQTIGTLQTTVFGIQSMMNIGNILKDDTLSLWQMFGQTLSSVGIGAVSVATQVAKMLAPFKGVTAAMKEAREASNDLKDLGASRKELKQALDDAAKLRKLSGIPSKDGTVRDTARNRTRLVNMFTKEDLEKWNKKHPKATEAERDQAAAEIKRMAYQKTHLLLLRQERSAELANAYAKKVSTKETIKNTLAGLKNAASKYKIQLATLGASVAITATIIVIKKLVEWYNRSATVAKSARENAEKLRNTYKQTKDDFEALMEAYDKYKTAKSAIDEMITGTKEWNKAVKELSADVIELINQYPSLAHAMEINKDGYVEINPLYMDQFIGAEEYGVYTSQQKALSGTNEAYLLDERNQITQFHRNSLTSEDTKDAVVGTVLTTILTIIGSFVPPVLIGAGAMAVGTGTGLGASLIPEPVLERLLKGYMEEGDAVFQDRDSLEKYLGDYTKYLYEGETPEETKELEKIRMQLQETIKSLAANRKALESNTLQLSSNIWQNLGRSTSVLFENSQYKDALVKIGKNALMISQSDIDDVLKNDKKTIDLTLLDYYRRDGNTFYTGPNDTTGITLEDEEIAAKLVSLRKSDALKQNAAHIMEVIDREISNYSEKLGALYLNVLSKENADLSKLTPKEATDWLTSQLSFADRFTEEELAEMGLTKSEVVEGIIESYRNLDKERDKHKELLTESPAKKMMAGIITNTEDMGASLAGAGLTYGDFFKFTSGVQSLYQQTGQTIDFTSIYGPLTAQEMVEFIRLFNEVDWTKKDAAEDFIAELDNMGIQIDEVAQKSFHQLNDTLEDVTLGFSGNVLAVEKVLKKLKQVGDIIEAQDYETLGKGAEDYFIKMSDGTYQLVEDAERFYNLVKEGQQDGLVKEINRRAAANLSIGDSEFAKGLNKTTSPENEDILSKQLLKLQLLNDTTVSGITQDRIKELQDRLATSVPMTREETEEINAAYMKSYNYAVVDYKDAIAKSLQKIAEASSDFDDFKNRINLTGLTKKEKDAAVEDYKTYALTGQLTGIEGATKTGFDDYKDNLKGIGSVVRMTEEEVEELDIAVLQLNKDITGVKDIWKDWTFAIDLDPTEAKYSEMITKMSSALEKVWDIPEDSLSSEFLKQKENQDLLKTFIEKGSWESYYKLSKNAAKDVAIQGNLKPNVDKAQLQTEIDNVIKDIDLSQLPIGVSLQTSTLVADLTKILVEAGKTTEEIQAIFDTLSIDVEITYDLIKAPYGGVGNVSVLTPSDFDTEEYDNLYPHLTPAERLAKYLSGEKVETHNVNDAVFEGPDRLNTVEDEDTRKNNKPEELDEEDDIEDEIDWYHDIDVILGQIEHDLEMIEKAQEKAFGKDLLNSYMEELHALEDQAAATEEKIRIGKAWAEYLRTKPDGLESHGVKFNPDGTVANYFEVFGDKQAQLQAMVDKYNRLTTKDAQDAYKKSTLDPAKESYEKFKKDFEKYEEIINKDIPGLEEDLKENLKRQIETQVAAFNMDIEIHLELAEAERDWNKFRRKVIEDLKESDILGNVMANVEDFKTYYNSAQNGAVQVAARHVQDLLNELRELDATGYASDTYEDDRKRALEDLKKHSEELRKNMEAAYDLILDTEKKYIDMLKEAEESFGKQLEAYQQVADIITHDMKVIDLIYGEDKYGDKAKYYDILVENDRQQVDFHRQEVALWAAQMSKAQREQNKEAYEESRKNWLSAVKDYNSALEQSIENITSKYVNAINEIFQVLNDKVTKGKGLAYIGEEWDLINKNENFYLDEINRAYGITDLERKYMDAIDGTDSLRIQQKIKDIMDEELEALREKDKLTEYDVERAERKYEILMKQIALEETQQNKSQLRLRRDSQGNYTYQYTADEDAIAEAEADLEKAKNDLYNFDKAEYQKKLGELYDVWSEFQEKMAEAAQINDPAKRKEREALLEEQYGQLINGLVAENATIRKNLEESAMDEVELMKDENLDKFMLEDIPYWTSGVQEMADVFAGEGGFGPTCKDAMDDLRDATEEYEEDLDDLEDVAEETFAAIKKGNDASITATQDLIKSNEGLIESYDDMLVAIANEIALLKEQIRLYEQLAQAKAIALGAHEYLEGQNVTAAQQAEWAKDLNMNTDYAGEMGKYAPGSEEYLKAVFLRDLKLSRNPHIDYGYATTDKVDMFYRLGKSLADYGVSTFNELSMADWQALEEQWAKVKGTAYKNDWTPHAEWDAATAKPVTPTVLGPAAAPVPTGSAVTNILNSLSNKLNSSLFAQMAKISSSIDSAIAGKSNKNSTTNQNVHIDASFPNVQSSNEILNALKNVVNVASQIANR